ncbi:MAG: class I SAM-dependent methyltransferase [Oligoflexales bacterium]
MKSILFVGCDYYTSFYSDLFCKFWRFFYATIEPMQEKAQYGSSQKHIVGKFEEFSITLDVKNRFDVVVINGVYEYGLNSPEQKKKSIDMCKELLEPGGIVLLGYRDRTPPDIETKLFMDAGFVRSQVFGFNDPIVKTKNPNQHTFEAFTYKGARS